MAPIKEHVLYAFGSIFPAAPPNLAANEPPDPPPRRNPPEPKPAAREILRPEPRKRAAKAPSRDAGDEPAARPQSPDPPAKPVRVLSVPIRLPIRSGHLGLDDQLIEAPFLHMLHPRLVKAATGGMELSVKDFIAGMIEDAIRQKAGLSPLAPQSFLQVLTLTSLDLPKHLVPHAMFIQRTLYDFAMLLPTRGSLQAPAAVIRRLKPVAVRVGDSGGKPSYDQGRFLRPSIDPCPPCRRTISRPDDGKGWAYHSQAGGVVSVLFEGIHSRRATGV